MRAEYKTEYLVWITKIENLTTNETILEVLQKEIIETNNSAFAYFFTIDFGYKPHLMQKIVLDNKDAKYAFLFAKDVINADIKALQNVVIKSKKIKYINWFDAYIVGANHKLLRPLIMGTKKPQYWVELAGRLSAKKDIEKIEDMLIDARAYKYMRLFAENIKGANIEKLEQAILDVGNVE